MTDPATPVTGPVRVHVRLFAMQRELAGTRSIDLELPAGAVVEDAWLALVERVPELAPGRASVRFAHNGGYAPADGPLADGDEVAMIPPVSGGAAPERGSPRIRILEIRDEPFSAAILAELSGRLATAYDGAVVGFLGVTRRSPGTPAPGQEAEAARISRSETIAVRHGRIARIDEAELRCTAEESEAILGGARLDPSALERIQRDIPAKLIVAGSKHSNFRQLAKNRLEESGKRCRCIRCREIGRLPSLAGPEIQVLEYEACGGTEYFISAVSDDSLIGFARLRFPSMTYRQELESAALMRELHVYGSLVPVGKDAGSEEWQHRQYGKALLLSAEEIALHAGFRRLAIMSGIGVRPYYRRQGYERSGPYMIRELS